jgi:hypothetical protein
MTDVKDYGFIAGTRVRATQDIDLRPYTTIKAGETMLVLGTPEGAPEGIEVLLDQHHVGLRHWDNRVLLVHPEVRALEPSVVTMSAITPVRVPTITMHNAVMD